MTILDYYRIGKTASIVNFLSPIAFHRVLVFNCDKTVL